MLAKVRMFAFPVHLQHRSSDMLVTNMAKATRGNRDTMVTLHFGVFLEGTLLETYRCIIHEKMKAASERDNFFSVYLLFKLWYGQVVFSLALFSCINISLVFKVVSAVFS